MIDQRNYDMIVLVLCALLLLFLVWKEWKRANRHHLVLRILSSAVAAACLLFLSTPLWQQGYEKVSHDAILITENANADSIAAFRNADKKLLPVFTLEQELAKKYNAIYIADAEEISVKKYRSIHVFGNGLAEGSLHDQSIVFHPSSLQTGVTAIHWRQQSNSGEKFLLQGSFHNASQFPARLVLYGYGQTMDSVTVPPKTDHAFSLRAFPKQLGRNVYRFAAVIKSDTVEKEPVPVNIVQAAPLKILMLSSSPDFETRFLRKWLAEKGYEVAARTTISKNKTGKEFLNTASGNIDRLSSDLLRRFDMVVADAGELSSLNSEELQALRNIISAAGKGMIVKADSALPRSLFFTNLFPVIPGDTALRHNLSMQLSSGDSLLQALALPATLYIPSQAGTRAVVTDKEKHILANLALYGAGKIIVTVMPNTYSYLLSGNADDYNMLWSELINNVLPGRITNEAWYFSPSIPRVHAPVTVSLVSDSASMPAAQIAGVSVYLSPVNEGVSWRGTFWPSRKGWQTGIALNGNSYYWYAFGKDDWKTISAAEKQKHTLVQEKEIAAGNAVSETWQPTKRDNDTKLILMILLLVSCAYLWFENKYYNA